MSKSLSYPNRSSYRVSQISDSHVIPMFKKKINTMLKNAFAGSRTRVYCLEGNYPNRWTTNACLSNFWTKFKNSNFRCKYLFNQLSSSKCPRSNFVRNSSCLRCCWMGACIGLQASASMAQHKLEVPLQRLWFQSWEDHKIHKNIITHQLYRVQAEPISCTLVFIPRRINDPQQRNKLP